MTSQLRQLTLQKQGLTQQQFGNGLTGTLKAIEHLGYVQIDTLSVVERAHHHVLWNRVPGYRLEHLNQLVKQQHIFEYWYHAASYLPMRDYRFALPNMKSIRDGKNRYYKQADPKVMKAVLARVSNEGPVRMRDFEDKKRSKNNSWNWGPVRMAFDKLFMQGDLMICERQGMEKIYDLTERCLPSDISLSMPSVNEYANYLFDTTLRAHGVFTWKQLLHLKTGQVMRNAMQEVVNQRIDAGEIELLRHANLPSTYAATEGFEPAASKHHAVKILSPFDNAVIHRDRLASLFQFDYRIECYVTKAKRVFGYFCLPILYDDKLVGRIDCKAHRADQRFEVLSFHLENDSIDLDHFFPALNEELQSFADFNQCPNLEQSVIK